MVIHIAPGLPGVGIPPASRGLEYPRQAGGYVSFDHNPFSRFEYDGFGLRLFTDAHRCLRFDKIRHSRRHSTMHALWWEYLGRFPFDRPSFRIVGFLELR